MVEGDIPITYLEMSNVVKGIKCPTCGAAYLLEETAKKLAQAEEMLETK